MYVNVLYEFLEDSDICYCYMLFVFLCKICFPLSVKLGTSF